MLRQGFLCWMSKLGGTYHDITAPIATLEQEESRDFITIEYLMSRQEIKEQYNRVSIYIYIYIFL